MTPVTRPLYSLLILVATASALAQDLDFRLVARSTPTGANTTTTLPGSISGVCVGETFFVEFWVSDVGSTNTGVSSAYVDLLWPSTLATAVSIDHGTLYNALTSGTIAAGSIDELGGSVLSATGVGIAPEWARVAVVELTADAAGASAFSLSSSSTGAAALGRGVIAWANIALSGVTVTGNPLPSDPTGAIATPATICAGGSSTLSATVGAGGDALEWFEGSCGGTPVAGQSPVVSPAVTTDYFVRSLNTTTGCVSACVQVTVTVNPLPSDPTGAIATPATICAGGSSTLSATVGAGGDTLEWFEGSCGGTPVAGQSPVVSPAVTTDYFVRSVNTATGCVSACVQVTVTVNPLPSDPTGAVATPATICAGGFSTLSATVGAGGDTLEWFEGSCGGTPVAGQSPVVSPAVTTDYFVRSVNTATGCVGACVQVTVTVDPSISGTVTTALNTPLSGVQVSADNGGGSDTTSASGNYQLCVPQAWSGTVTPCLTGWRFAPPDLNFANVTAPVSGADFVGTQVYDLDPPSGGDEFVGVGDFSFFAPSWQQSVPPNDPSDFDCDGFVGSADFSFFVTAWLKSVFDPTISFPVCRQCSGGPGPLTDLWLELRFVAVRSPGAQNQVPALPRSLRQVRVGDTYFVEVWVRDPDGLSHGVSSAYVDVAFGGESQVHAVIWSGIFGTFASGAIGDGIVDDLGGSSFLEGLGADGRWARVATLEVEAARNGVAQYQPSESAMGFAAYGQGYVPWSQIKTEGVAIRHVEPMRWAPADRP